MLTLVPSCISVKRCSRTMPPNLAENGLRSKSGQPSTLRSTLQKAQSVTEQGTADRPPLQEDQSVTEQA
ncbi:hypothetical protein OS493_031787 [Desmophyllum pertusum]|uniref:Uncharacterized protein n=1 Tax=Desmophyllum pertusum TaxID=174260 RepID=A0A9W9Z812_9CNID|nr:hypothetical protein OS493_031787 [Desmophyllum pertusum]